MEPSLSSIQRGNQQGRKAPPCPSAFAASSLVVPPRKTSEEVPTHRRSARVASRPGQKALPLQDLQSLSDEEVVPSSSASPSQEDLTVEFEREREGRKKSAERPRRGLNPTQEDSDFPDQMSDSEQEIVIPSSALPLLDDGVAQEEEEEEEKENIAPTQELPQHDDYGYQPRPVHRSPPQFTPHVVRTLPKSAKDTWRAVAEKYFRRYKEAEEDDVAERERLIMEILDLPHRCLQVPTSADKGALHKRLQQALQEKIIVPSENNNRRDKSSNIERCVSVLRAGGLKSSSRAVRALSQDGLPELTPEMTCYLKTLHPARDLTTPFPFLPDSITPVVTVEQSSVVKNIKKVDPTAAPGPSCWTASHLSDLTENSTCMAGFSRMIKDIINGIIRGEAKDSLLKSNLIAIAKQAPGEVRPIAMSETFYKMAGHYVMNLITPHLDKLFPSIQYGVGQKGGPEKAAHLLRAMHEVYRGRMEKGKIQEPIVLLKTDFKNAFNSCSRGRCMQALLSHEQTKPACRLFHWAYFEESDLVLHHRDGMYAETLKSAEGVKQGDPLSAFAFSLSIQPLLEECVKDLPDLTAVAYQDDFNLVGCQSSVIEAFNRLRNKCTAFNLSLVPHKCQLILTSREIQRDTTLANRLAEDLQVKAVLTMETLGTIITPTAAPLVASKWCKKQAEKATSVLPLLSDPEMPTQMGFLLLQNCVSPMYNYIARTLDNKTTHVAANDFDGRIWASALQILKISPKHAAETDTQASLPRRMGGLGLRKVEEILPAAFLSSSLGVFPHIAREGTSLAELKATTFWTTVVQAAEEVATTPGSTKENVPLTEDQLENFYMTKQEVPEGSQHLLTKHKDQDNLNRLLSAATEETKNRIKASSSTTSSLFLRVAPTKDHPEHVMSDEAFSQAVRHRLGIQPTDNQQLLRKECACGKSLEKDPFHLHACMKHRHGVHVRHNILRDTLASLAKQCGAVVRVEPLLPNPNPIRNPQAPVLRPDLLVITPHSSTMIDVSVVCTSCTSAPSTTDRARRKTAKYEAMAKHNNCKFTPAVLESHGRISLETQKLLKEWSRQPIAPVNFFQDSLNLLSVALQRGNSFVSTFGLSSQAAHLQNH